MMDHAAGPERPVYIDVIKGRKLVSSYQFIPNRDYVALGLLSQVQPILTVSKDTIGDGIVRINDRLIAIGCEELLTMDL